MHGFPHMILTMADSQHPRQGLNPSQLSATELNEASGWVPRRGAMTTLRWRHVSRGESWDGDLAKAISYKWLFTWDYT